MHYKYRWILCEYWESHYIDKLIQKAAYMNIILSIMRILCSDVNCVLISNHWWKRFHKEQQFKYPKTLVFTMYISFSEIESLEAFPF